MKLHISVVVTDDDGTGVSDQSVSMDANNSGVVHSLKPLGDALLYAASLDLFIKKKIPAKDSLGNVRAIAKDVIDSTTE